MNPIDALEATIHRLSERMGIPLADDMPERLEALRTYLEEPVPFDDEWVPCVDCGGTGEIDDPLLNNVCPDCDSLGARKAGRHT